MQPLAGDAKEKEEEKGYIAIAGWLLPHSRRCNVRKRQQPAKPAVHRAFPLHLTAALASPFRQRRGELGSSRGFLLHLRFAPKTGAAR